MPKPVDIALLHGGGQGSWVWDEIIPLLQASDATGRILALDIPGCGTKRSVDTTAVTPGAAADELIAEMRTAGLSDVLLVGHSQAGTMLPLLAERAPDLFKRLVYISCAAPLPNQTIINMMGEEQRGTVQDEVGWPGDPKTMARSDLQKLMFCNDMDAASATAFVDKLDKDRWPDLITFGSDWSYDHLEAVPTTYMICLTDNILPVRWQEEFARRLHADEVVTIDAGHQPMNSRPEELAALLMREASR